MQCGRKGDRRLMGPTQSIFSTASWEWTLVLLLWMRRSLPWFARRQGHHQTHTLGFIFIWLSGRIEDLSNQGWRGVVSSVAADTINVGGGNTDPLTVPIPTEEAGFQLWGWKNKNGPGFPQWMKGKAWAFIPEKKETARWSWDIKVQLGKVHSWGVNQAHKWKCQWDSFTKESYWSVLRYEWKSVV